MMKERAAIEALVGALRTRRDEEISNLRVKLGAMERAAHLTQRRGTAFLRRIKEQANA